MEVLSKQYDFLEKIESVLSFEEMKHSVYVPNWQDSIRKTQQEFSNQHEINVGLLYMDYFFKELIKNISSFPKEVLYNILKEAESSLDEILKGHQTFLINLRNDPKNITFRNGLILTESVLEFIKGVEFEYNMSHYDNCSEEYQSMVLSEIGDDFYPTINNRISKEN